MNREIARRVATELRQSIVMPPDGFNCILWAELARIALAAALPTQTVLLVAGGRSMRFGPHAAQSVTHTPELVATSVTRTGGDFVGHAWTAVGKDFWIDTTLGADAMDGVATMDALDGRQTVPDVWPFPDIHIQDQTQMAPKQQWRQITQGHSVGVGYNRCPTLTREVRVLAADGLSPVMLRMARQIGEAALTEVATPN